MMDLFLEYSETFGVQGVSVAELERNGGRIMEALLDLEGGVDQITDSAVATDGDAMTITVEFAMTVPSGMDREQMLISARSVARTAIHVTGGHTPQWEPESMGETLELEDA